MRIWDVATGRERATLKGHTSYVEAVAVAPDGSWLASGGWDDTVRIWDVTTEYERSASKGHSGDVRAVAVAPDCAWLASGGSDYTVRIWDVATRQPRAVMRLDSNISACIWLGTKGVTVSGSAGLYMFDFMADHIATTAQQVPADPNED